jgi:leucine-rich repeat protein SHOC2
MFLFCSASGGVTLDNTTKTPRCKSSKHVVNLTLNNTTLRIQRSDSLGTLDSPSNLQTLRLDHNQLVPLPNQIGMLVYLRHLDASHNYMKVLPSTLGDVTQLRTLANSNNQLRSLPGNIGNLSLMTSMVAYSNELMSVPPRLGDCTSLKSLQRNSKLTHLIIELHPNRLTQLPARFRDLAALEELTLLKNQITQLQRHGIWQARKP